MRVALRRGGAEGLVWVCGRQRGSGSRGRSPGRRGRGLAAVPGAAMGRSRVVGRSSGRKMPIPTVWSWDQGAVGPSSAPSTNAGEPGRGARAARSRWEFRGEDGPLVGVDGCEAGGDGGGVLDGRELRPQSPGRDATATEAALQDVDAYSRELRFRPPPDQRRSRDTDPLCVRGRLGAMGLDCGDWAARLGRASGRISA